jgi:AraC-like DNA-binding protein
MSRTIELSAVYARLILQSGIAETAELLRGSDITESALAEQEFIAALDLANIFRNFDRYAPDRGWTARLGAQFNMATHGPLGFAALSAPTLGEALDVMGALQESRNTALSAQTFATDTHYVMRVTDVTTEPGFRDWLVEVVLKIVEELFSTILGHRVGKNVLICFSHPQPPGAAPLLAGFDSTVVFGALESSIAVPLAWRHLPSPLYDESVYRANVIKCREQIAARNQAGSVAVAVRNRLSNHFDTLLLDAGKGAAPPTLEQVAQAMHLTPRTLIRKLQREDTAYKTLLEDLRRDYAQRLLQDARLKVTDVADVLGYREAANFTRAFKRWHGVSPTVWRRR